MPIDCPEANSALGPRAYLEDLLDYATSTRLSRPGGPVDAEYLKARFHQPFAELLSRTHDEVTREETAVRLATEVLRRFVGTPSNPELLSLLRSAEKDYVVQAYERLLAGFGTSYAELRLARGADAATRRALADRIGISLSETRPDFLDLMTLDPAAITEEMLEERFGLDATTGDPFVHRMGGMLQHRLWHLLVLWRDADRAAGRVIVDPDLLVADDFVHAHEGATVYDIFLARRQRYRAFREEAQGLYAKSGLPSLFVTYLGISAADLLALAARRESGEDVRAEVAALRLRGLELAALARAWRIVSSGSALLDTELQDVFDIVWQAVKRGLTEGWLAEEETVGVSLRPDTFRIPPPPVESGEPVIERPFFGPPEEKYDWQAVLEERIAEEAELRREYAELLRGVEEAELPALRDALIAASGAAGADLDAKAATLADRLFVDFRGDPFRLTSRVALAIETLQGIIEAANGGELAGGDDPLTLADGDFDRRWKWLGTLSNWRASMAVYLYPENLIAPTTRPQQSAAFRALAAELGGGSAVTREAACAAAERYQVEFTDICSLRVEATCEVMVVARDCVGSTAPPILHLTGVVARAVSGERYFGAWDRDAPSSPPPQPVWQPLSLGPDVDRILGLLVYTTGSGRAFLYVFYRASDAQADRLMYVRRDLDHDPRQAEGWSSPRELPVETASEGRLARFNLVLRQDDVYDGGNSPHFVLVRQPRTLLARGLDADGVGWDDRGWIDLFPGVWGDQANFVFQQLHAGVQLENVSGRRRHLYVYQHGGSLVLLLSGGASPTVARLAPALPDVPDPGPGGDPGPVEPPEPPDPDTFFDGFIHMLLAEGRFVGAFRAPGTATRAAVQIVWMADDGASYVAEVYRRRHEKQDWPGAAPLLGLAIRAGDEIGSPVTIAYQSGNPFSMWRARYTPGQGDPPSESERSLLGPRHSGLLLLEADPRSRRTALDTIINADNNDGVTVRHLHLEEAFLWVPVQVARALQAGGDMAAAFDWHRMVYDWTAPAGERKIYPGLVTEQAFEELANRPQRWLADPPDPHQIAANRRNAHTRHVLGGILETHVAAAAAAFAGDGAEAIARATALYLDALDLLDADEITGAPRMWRAYCIPDNPRIDALRGQATANLAKIRGGRNLAGLLRELPVYARPGALERALLGNAGALEAPPDQRPTPYRFAFLLERARRLVGLAANVEAAMLTALEKREAVAYDELKARHDQQMADVSTRIRRLQAHEARATVEVAKLQRERAQIQHRHYDDLVNSGWNFWEKAGFVATAVAGAAAAVVGTVATGGAGAVLIGAAVAAGAGGAGGILTGLRSYDQRNSEWEMQRDVAKQDMRIATQQIGIAQIGVAVADQEVGAAELAAAHSAATVDFLVNRFFDTELYEWMSGVLAGIYRNLLQQATSTAKLAETQLAFERQEAIPSFIRADYWEPVSSPLLDVPPDRRGLTGSARLLQDVEQLDQFAFETTQRKLQLTKTLSLVALGPAEFQRFRETGVLRFATPMDLFDRDFPGHYLRLVRRVKTQVIALTPPAAGIRATLSARGASRVVVADRFRTVALARSPERVALSTPRETSGLFEPESQPELLQPFEGMGVDTTWELSLPKPANPFSYDGVIDVLFTLEYTALEAPDLRRRVVRRLGDQRSMEIAFSLRNDFADAWYELANPELSATPLAVSFAITDKDLPAHFADPVITQLALYFARGDELREADVEFQIDRLLLRRDPNALGGPASTDDGIASTRRPNGAAWTGIVGQHPAGTWELAVADTPENRERFCDGGVTDVLLIMTLSGRTPPWPG